MNVLYGFDLLMETIKGAFGFDTLCLIPSDCFLIFPYKEIEVILCDCKTKCEKFYLAGPMTGYPDYNWNKFKDATKRLREQLNFEIVSPVEITDEMGGQRKFIEDTEHQKKVWGKLIEEIESCDGIVLMEGWQKSTGAKRELKIALENDKQVYLLEEMI